LTVDSEKSRNRGFSCLSAPFEDSEVVKSNAELIMNLVELKSVNYQRSNLDTNRQIDIQNLNLTIERGDFIHLKGNTGSGKSTLVDFILGHKQPDSGEIRVFGDLPGKVTSRLKTGVALQKIDTSFQQAGWLNLIDLIESHYPEGKGKVNSFLQEFGIDLSNNQTDFAGGEERLLFVALSQAGHPELLILDEPTTFLDTHKRQQLCQKLNELAESGTTILFISHIEDDLTKLHFTKTITLEDGKLTETQHRDLYPHPDLAQEQSVTIDDRLSTINWLLHWFKVFWQHVKFNLARTWRTDRKYLYILLGSSIIYATIVSLLSQVNQAVNTDAIANMVNAYSPYLGIAAMTSTGSIIALERQQKFWMKTINILPLPPFIYLLAKVATSLIINIVQIVAMLCTKVIVSAVGAVGFSSIPDLLATILDLCPQYLVLGLGFIVGIIPYLSIGSILGYFADPKSIQILALITSFSLALPLYLRSAIELFEIIGRVPGKYNLFKLIGDNMAAHSPTYHYLQMILGLGNSPAFDRYMWIHIAWLLWFTVVVSIVSVWVDRYNFNKAANS
jgi:ABC-2 type transport system ATP-binding protein